MQKFVNYVEKIQLVFGAIFLVIFVIATLLQVSTRYLGISATWTEEVAVNSFIWAVFLGASVMVRQKQHFSFNFLVSYLSKKNAFFLIMVQNLILIVFCILCCIYSSEITQAFWNSKWISIPQFRQGYVWLILPITFISMSIYLIEDSIKQIVKFKTEQTI